MGIGGNKEKLKSSNFFWVFPWEPWALWATEKLDKVKNIFENLKYFQFEFPWAPWASWATWKNESLPILSIYVVISKFSANGVEVMVIFMTCGQREYRG